MSKETLVLWVYIIWYLAMVCQHFDGNPGLWGNSLGLSLIVGTALVLATGTVTRLRLKKQFWQLFRLYCCPFCVSSFSALTKDQGFELVFSPEREKNLWALLGCLGFVLVVLSIKWFHRPLLVKQRSR
ncbi:MAG: hypothetical protein V7629_06485 [Motiliproteus sp.]